MTAGTNFLDKIPMNNKSFYSIIFTRILVTKYQRKIKASEAILPFAQRLCASCIIFFSILSNIQTALICDVPETLCIPQKVRKPCKLHEKNHHLPSFFFTRTGRFSVSVNLVPEFTIFVSHLMSC